MISVKGETSNVKWGYFVQAAMVIALTVSALTACAGSSPLSDPRQMTFKSVEFTPPEPDRVVFENGMVVYLLEDQDRKSVV